MSYIQIYNRKPKPGDIDIKALTLNPVLDAMERQLLIESGWLTKDKPNKCRGMKYYLGIP